MKMKYMVITKFEDEILGRKVFDSLDDAAKYAEGKAKKNKKWASVIKKVPAWVK